MAIYKILIIESDLDINMLLNTMLIKNGYTVKNVLSASQGKSVLKKEQFDCVLLDLMLPEIDSEQLISYIRERYIVPIIVISAKLTADTKAATLQLGADDFISGPFNNEILNRIEAQICRSNVFISEKQTEESIFYHKNCELNMHTMMAVVNGCVVGLTVLEFNILAAFFQHPERVLTRADLYHLCWKQEFFDNNNTIDVHICHIRKKIAGFDDAEYIETVRGMGYKLSF